MRHITLTLLLILILTSGYSQSLKTVKIKTPIRIRTKEIFQVKKETPTIKNGSYEKYKNKKLIEVGFFKDNQKDSVWKIYNQGGQLIATGQFLSDTMVGVWNYFSRNNVLVQKYDHDKDSLIYFDVDEEKKIDILPNNYPGTAQEQMAIFIGGITYMMTLLENNMVYPEEGWSKSIDANVLISFVVDANGNTTKVKSLKPVGDGFDEEGIRLVESLGKAWIPAIQNGQKVKFHFKFPLKFKLR